MNTRHEKEFFFKFMTVSTVKIVLSSSSFRWRTPKQFNDPFDHQMSFIFPFSHEDLYLHLRMNILRLIYDEAEVQLSETVLSRMIEILRQLKEKIPRDELYRTLDDGIEKYVEKFDSYVNNINALISNDLNQSRVLCVSERNDNVVMWSHYAEEHRGVCVRLQCIEEIDNTLLIAKPVRYQDTFPNFLSVEDFVGYLTGENQLSVSKLLYEIPYLKHSDWSYEREWRVHVPHSSPNLTGYDDWRESERVFGAIYLGCRISQTDANEIMQIVDHKYPHMEVYQATESKKGFFLEFVRIK